MPELWCFTTTLIEQRFLSRSSLSLTLDCTIYYLSPSMVVVLYDNFYWTLARTCVWWLIRTSAWYVFPASEWSLSTPQHYNSSLLTLNLKITIISFFRPQHYSNSVCPRPGLVADLWSQWSLIFWLHSYTNEQWYVVTYNQDTGQIDKFANLKNLCTVGRHDGLR